MSLNNFEDFVIENKVIGFTKRLPKSGKSHFYVNWREPTYDAYLLDKLSDYIRYLAHSDIKFDCLYGVPEGASKVAIVSALKLAQKSSDYKKGVTLSLWVEPNKAHGKAEDKYLSTTKGQGCCIRGHNYNWDVSLRNFGQIS